MIFVRWLSCSAGTIGFLQIANEASQLPTLRHHTCQKPLQAVFGLEGVTLKQNMSSGLETNSRSNVEKKEVGIHTFDQYRSWIAFGVASGPGKEACFSLNCLSLFCCASKPSKESQPSPSTSSGLVLASSNGGSGTILEINRWMANKTFEIENNKQNGLGKLGMLSLEGALLRSLPRFFYNHPIFILAIVGILPVHGQRIEWFG